MINVLSFYSNSMHKTYKSRAENLAYLDFGESFCLYFQSGIAVRKYTYDIQSVTVFTGLPPIYALRFSTTVFTSLSRVSKAAHAT